MIVRNKSRIIVMVIIGVILFNLNLISENNKNDNYKLIFNQFMNDSWTIVKINEDGSELVYLTSGKADDLAPRVSPDNTKILFESNRDGNSEVYCMNIDGSGQINLTKNPAVDEDASWSPDGEKIVFISNREGYYHIFIMNADGSNQRKINDVLTWLTPIKWSPDGNRLAYLLENDDIEYRNDLVIADINTGERKIVTDFMLLLKIAVNPFPESYL